MTACTNKARGAVVAALAGALALGAAPAVALATTGDVSLQFVAGGTAQGGAEFANGDIALSFSSAAGTVTEGTDADGNMTVSASYIPFTVTAESVTPAGTVHEIEVTPGHDYKVALYKADADKNPTGSPLSGNRVTEAGDYVLTVTPLTGADYVGQTFKQYFKIVPVQIKVDGIWEDAAASDNFFRYTGSPINVEFTNDGNVLTEGVDYTVKYTKVVDYGNDGTAGSDDEGVGETTDKIVDAGKYTATLTGLGKYEGTSTTTSSSSPIDVTPYYLTNDSKQQVVIDPFTGTLPEHPSFVYWDDTDDERDGGLDATLLNVSNANGTITSSGPYTVNVDVDSDALASGNVIDQRGSKTATAVKMDAPATLTYHGQAVQDSYDVFVGTTDTFGKADFKAMNGSTALSTGDISVTGNVNTMVPGEYDITVTYNLTGTPGQQENSSDPAVKGKVFAASKTIKVRVWKGAVNADTDLYVYGPDYVIGANPGVAITSYERAYDGSELTTQDFLVVDKDRTVSNLPLDSKLDLPNLTVTLYKADGTKVDSITDAGEYYLEVTSEDYKLSGNTRLPITIAKVDLNSAEVGKIVKWNDVAGEEYLPSSSTGWNSNATAITELGLVYDTGNEGAAYSDVDNFAESDAASDYKGQDLLPDCVDVVVEYNDNGTWKPVANAEKLGDYRVILTVGDDIAANFDGASKTIEFEVAEGKGYFKDVQPSDWYYNEVQTALEKGYMYGTVAPEKDTSGKYVPQSGTFSPRSVLTRGEVACVLYNVSGANLDENDKGYDELTGWATGFSDMDGKEFYAEAVYWAKQNGVINGYGDGTFGGDRQITREEFAAMLANFAQKVLGDEDVAKDNSAALEAMPDADQVTDWAEQGVAWAVSKGVMGNDGKVTPSAKMDRGTCAAMVVNYTKGLV